MTGPSRLFTIDHRDRDTGARTGTLHLPHGQVETPAFMPVGTAGAVKAITPTALEDIGYRLILGNTYHLYLRPGMEVMRSFGGLHSFSGWHHNVLTDSGGYQVFSLARLRTVTDDGVTFQSHIDGARHHLTPERVVEIQTTIGSDIQMALDVCTGPEADRGQAEEALRVTTLWARRARDHRCTMPDDYDGHLFPIVQGNFFCDLRLRSVETTMELEPAGVAIGGLSVGETFAQFADTLACTAQALPESVPRYVMGIGTPEYLLEAMENGIDMFDCVYPTRAARNATLMTTQGRINLRNARYASAEEAPDPVIDSFGGRAYSLGYLRHLFKAKEILGPVLATEHNLRFMAYFMEHARRAIREDRFAEFKREWRDVMS